MTLSEFIIDACTHSAGLSDIILKEGQPPLCKVDGAVMPTEGSPVTRADLGQFLEEHGGGRLWQEIQQGRLDADLSLKLPGGGRLRVNLGQAGGRLTMVARRVPSGALDLESLGLPTVLNDFTAHRHGLILLVGATGCGKSTTLAAMIHHLNRRAPLHVITIEDPVEYVHEDICCHISQREVGTDTRDFAGALRQVVRQSPDVILIGELRDRESVEIALQAARTGHLVLATLHASSCVSAVERLLGFFPENSRPLAAQDLAASLRAIVSQRLLQRADGQGRLPVCEILPPSPLMARQVAQMDFSALADILRHGNENGCIDFTRALADAVLGGRLNAETALAAADHPDELRLLLEGMRTGTGTFKADGVRSSTMSMKLILKQALAAGASDIILTVGCQPLVRVNGELLDAEGPVLNAADTRRLLFSLLNSRQRVDFEERREIDLALSVALDAGQERRFRLNGFIQRGAIACALRVINDRVPDPAKLGLPHALLRMATHHQGLILVTGPTGHGKSTSLACVIERINRHRACHIITIEDPIEFVYQNKKAVIEQREIGADTLSFSNALKYILRQNPDVILIGEMRDPETIACALTAAETGHLVLATLHTNDACQSIDRIVDAFPPSQQSQIRAQLSASLLGVVSQRLLPRADGKGRIGAFEVMVGTTSVRALCRDGKTHQLRAVIENSAKDGMQTLDSHLRELYMQGLVSRDEVLAVALDKNLL